MSLAPPFKKRWAFAISALIAASSAPVHAQAQQPPGKGTPRVEDPDAPVTIRAEEINGRPERELVLTRDVEVVRDKMRVTAESACYRQVESELEAKDNVRIWRFGDYYTADEFKINTETGVGFMLQPTYKLEMNNAQGKARRIDFLSEDQATVIDGTYSTCEGPNPDWYVKSSTLTLDQGRDVGVASGTVVYFKDVPLIGTPALSFSLSGARRSGLLPAVPGFSSRGGAELTLPYYFNIAPNRDLTVSPHYISRRGLQIGAVGRYIGETDAGTYEGRTAVEYLHNDKERGIDRWQITSTHSQALAKDWSFGWNVRAASDEDYPTDFSKNVAGSAERQLLKELRTDYRGEYWGLTARVQKYQVLQDPDTTTLTPRPYDRLPAVNFHAARYDVGGFDWQVNAEVTRFHYSDETICAGKNIAGQTVCSFDSKINGDRVVVQPQVSFPIISPSYFITPKLMLSATAYQLDAFGKEESRSVSKAVPTFSLDSGLEFERSTKLFGRAVTQTLEPRLFYVYTPYRDQTDVPVFDTADATFNFTQLFAENRFVGSDRIGDANQMTAAIVSRFLEESGAERLRLAFGQRFYFKDQRVQLTDTATAVTSRRSDLLLAATGRISETWGVDSAVQYNQGDHRVETSNFNVQWQPGPKKVFNAGYRFQRDNFKNIDFSTQWPISQKWFGVGRMSYSMKDHRILESLVGLEYNCDCWVFRMGAQRFVTTTNKTSSQIFFQLELNGLSKFGIGNPLEVLKNSIPGYQRLNEGYRR
ncbi:LPS-assembly protein [Pseudoduganella flava]|uniref:LPS-assembly protein LptD n=1 Tax=Pseudoduganella flava TaxID=871742 RepID=A0A562PXP6_9BURK|nr:LPS-assembly protein LptD [Pseudoduganella flava]QGZ39989.1 LPS assembly protein LptD [Pseudoduganella flava]TWI48930.1 LPS-assembly protein [Pseudoduganella flava]